MYGINGNNFLKKIIKLSINSSKKEIKIVDDQFGSPTPTSTLVKQIDIICKKRLKGIYHTSSEGNCSWYDFAVACVEKMNIKNRFIPCNTNQVSFVATRPKNSVLENFNLKKINQNCFNHWKNELGDFIDCNNEFLIKELDT